MKKRACKILKKSRLSYGYTQQEVANWIGTHRTNYSRKERGEVSLTADEFLTLLDKFNEKGPKKRDAEILNLLESFNTLSKKK